MDQGQVVAHSGTDGERAGNLIRLDRKDISIQRKIIVSAHGRFVGIEYASEIYRLETGVLALRVARTADEQEVFCSGETNSKEGYGVFFFALPQQTKSLRVKAGQHL